MSACSRSVLFGRGRDDRARPLRSTDILDDESTMPAIAFLVASVICPKTYMAFGLGRLSDGARASLRSPRHPHQVGSTVPGMPSCAYRSLARRVPLDTAIAHAEARRRFRIGPRSLPRAAYHEGEAVRHGWLQVPLLIPRMPG